MTLGVRIGLALMAPVVLLALLAIYQLSVIDRLVDQGQDIRLVSSRVEAAGVELRERASTLAELGDKMRALEDPEYARAAEETKREIQARISALRDLHLEGAEGETIERLAAAWSGTVDREPYPGRPEIEAFDAHIDAMIGASREEAKRAVEQGVAQAASARRVSIVIAALAVIGAGLLALLLVRMVSKPVRRMAAATRALARGEFSRRAEPSGPPELAALAEDFNAMAARLGQIDHLKDELLSNVSHDLKAPLASMHETNELLLEGIPGSLTPQQEQLVRFNQASNASLSKMVSDLLDLSRLQGGVMTYRFGRHDLGNLARDGVRDLVGVAHARKIRVDVEVPVAPLWVEGDETLLLRAIENLVTNAIRYSPNGGRVRVEVGPAHGGTATLTVEDQGRGVPDEHKDRVFERFYRVDSKRKGGLGTGIGLAIVKSIVEGHQGSIRVEDAAGGGSRFVIELPAAVTARAERPQSERAVTGGAT